ncbi:TetR/AcrR family transcriptional regulator [Hyphococcus luteus]|uniref:TetR/AcrR family transcriptional regulator n=1 Tax=Hyphococcus luteus TaxID=2058213 RepID=A0A2S7K8H5_9PROT|nr:TetR/AcrR family transcriptional regulator [Marinicaulis flavus]PQA88792.1 TetR/AcrR family transcriptional regulator [Marinicaulis flavus]
MPAEVLDETAKQILDAASRRFLHYGYGKTTMSEIAQDCNMSTGNLYRYFPSKLDIAEMFVRVLRREQAARLREVADDPDMNPAEKLRAFFGRKFQLAYERFHDKPKAYELSRELITSRPKVAIEWENAEARVLTEILLEGDREGVFAIENAGDTARIIQDACYRFTSPSILQDSEYEALSVELNGVIDLILDGFAWRAAKRAAQDKRKQA